MIFPAYKAKSPHIRWRCHGLIHSYKNHECNYEWKQKNRVRSQKTHSLGVFVGCHSYISREMRMFIRPWFSSWTRYPSIVAFLGNSVYMVGGFSACFKFQLTFWSEINITVSHVSIKLDGAVEDGHYVQLACCEWFIYRHLFLFCDSQYSGSREPDLCFSRPDGTYHFSALNPALKRRATAPFGAHM